MDNLFATYLLAMVVVSVYAIWLVVGIDRMKKRIARLEKLAAIVSQDQRQPTLHDAA